MKNLALSLAVFCCVVASVTADSVSTNADYVAGEQSTVLITPELRYAAAQLFGSDAAQQILHAVELNMTKYDRDMRTDSGRRAWHGKLHREVVSTNDLCKISIYSNEVTGAVWKYRQPFTRVEVSRFNSTLPRPVMTNGVPEALAKARARREAERVAVSNITVNVEANK